MNGPLSGFVRVAEDLRELGPVRDPHRRVDGTAGRQADERGDRRADALDRLVRGRDLLDVDAGSQVRGHVTPPLGLDDVRCSARCGALRDGRRRRAAACRDTGSRTSITVLVPGPEDRPWSRGTRRRTRSPRASRAVRCRDRARRCPGAAAARPATIAPGRPPGRSPRCPSSASTRRMPMRMIGSRFPSRTRARRLVGPRDRASPTGVAAARGRSGSRWADRVPVRSLLRRCARASRRPARGRRARARDRRASASRLAAVGGARDHAGARRAGSRSKRKRPVARRSTASSPASGSATQASATGSPSASRDACRRSGASRSSSAPAPSESRVRTVCVRTSGPRSNVGAGLDRERDHVVDRRLVLAADRASRSRPSPRLGWPTARLDRGSGCAPSARRPSSSVGGSCG